MSLLGRMTSYLSFRSHSAGFLRVFLLMPTCPWSCRADAVSSLCVCAIMHFVRIVPRKGGGTVGSDWGDRYLVFIVLIVLEVSEG